MRNYCFLILCLLSFGFLSAQEELSKEEKERRERNIQAGNPFAKFGYKAKVATLSKGKYLEVHDLDSIVTIGTTRWHVDKNKIVGDIVIDSLNPDARPIGDVAGRWISPDPLSEEFPSWSPYTYVENKPIVAVDPDGKRIIFINGYLGFGSPKGGSEYWNDGFVTGAHQFFNDYSRPHFTDIDHSMFSSASDRKSAGYEYAKINYANLTEGMKEGESFNLVSHSMGGAFLSGIQEYLQEKGHKVDGAVLLNSYQADDIDINTDDTYVVDYQNTNDPVLFWFDTNLGYGSVKNADVLIRNKSDKKLENRHRHPISLREKFWETLLKQIEDSYTKEYRRQELNEEKKDEKN